MKNTKKLKTFSIYTIISFFTLVVIFFFSSSKKIITTYEIRNNFTENKINVKFFENLFNFKLRNLSNNSTPLENFYFDISVNYSHIDYGNSMSNINNFFELFNKNLKKELTLNSLNSQTILKSYSFKNIPERIYEVKIISDNPEDAQKFFEKNVSQNIKKINNKILEELYDDYINKKTKDISVGRFEINNLISGFEYCLEENKDDMTLNLFCKFYKDINLYNRHIKFLKSTSITLNTDLNEFELITADPIKMMKNDYLYNSFVIIHKKENIEYISFSKIFILYLLSLILVWILIFKTNYFNLLLKNKLFKFPK